MKVDRNSIRKELINLSEIDYVISLLDQSGFDYRIEALGEVHFNGASYKMRRLEYKNNVILERTTRGGVNDSDIIESRNFLKEEEPLDWEIEIEEF